VVHKKVEPLASLYDEEIVIFLQDWYHTEGRSLATPRPDAAHWLPYALINGASTFNCSNTGEFARWCTHVNQTNFNVKPGMRYRLRIIAGTARVGLRFAVAGHSMTVINRQGTDMKPFVTNELFMSIADRYDVILHADQPIGEYLIRVKITGCDACSADGSVNAQPNLGHDVFATLRYQGATPGSAAPFALYQDAVTVPVAYVDRRVTPLVPVAPPAATKTWALTLTSERFFYPNDVAPHRMWFFNGKMFHPSPVPLLFQAKEGKVFSATEVCVFD
jgi:iron transport multicopper oxidase